MLDSWGRTISYLRISVTDRCNFRCVYCMPPEGIVWQPHDMILSYEEITKVVQVAASQGVKQVRLTGGEPLVRSNLASLVQMIAAIPGIEDIAVTTNGFLLERQAKALAEAGLRRVNISLDTIQPDKFARITRGGSLEAVWRGIEAAEKYGIVPIKINAVLMRGVNDDEIEDLARLTLDRAWQVRFIELMPMQTHSEWGHGFPTPQQAYLPLSEVIEKLNKYQLEPVASFPGAGPAQIFRLKGGKGTIGLISPLSDHQFCQRCNRMRLTADGNLRPCLMSNVEVPVLKAVRSDEPLLPIYQKAIGLKPKGHQLNPDDDSPSERFMAQIGG